MNGRLFRTVAGVFVLPQTSVVYGLALGDLDGDGYLDIVAARSDAPNMVYFSAASGGR